MRICSGCSWQPMGGAGLNPWELGAIVEALAHRWFCGRHTVFVVGGRLIKVGVSPVHACCIRETRWMTGKTPD